MPSPILSAITSLPLLPFFFILGIVFLYQRLALMSHLVNVHQFGLNFAVSWSSIQVAPRC